MGCLQLRHSLICLHLCPVQYLAGLPSLIHMWTGKRGEGTSSLAALREPYICPSCTRVVELHVRACDACPDADMRELLNIGSTS